MFLGPQFSRGHKHGQKKSHRNFIPCSRQHFSWIYSLCQPFCHISSKNVSFWWKTVFLILDKFEKSDFFKNSKNIWKKYWKLGWVLADVSRRRLFFVQKSLFWKLSRIKNTVFHQKLTFFEELRQNGGYSRHIQEKCYPEQGIKFLCEFFWPCLWPSENWQKFSTRKLRNETLKSRNFLKKFQSLTQS